ncbi:MAG: hypothetical protein FWF35_04420 [Elusimicrobia bacterium]|nr:hypothetical protein [Elusimicrobiota bacterium]
MPNKKLLQAALTLALLLTGCHNASSEKTQPAPPLQITKAYIIPVTETFDNYLGRHFLSFVKIPHYDGLALKDAYSINLQIENTPPADAKYSLYTYKKTFAQGGKRNYMQGIRECDSITPLATQEDIDKNLDKIYETTLVTEGSFQSYGAPAPTKYLKFEWDGSTNPQFTGGQKYAVRDCLVAAVHDEGGKLISMKDLTTAAEGYAVTAGTSYTAGDKTISAKIYTAYDRPPKKIWAFLMVENCGIGALTYDVVNQGGAAIAADINRRLPGDVAAYTELTNPSFDTKNSLIKIYEWKDIKGVDGKDFTPAPDKPQYRMALILETDDMTFTGIKDGYIYDGAYQVVPSPKKVKTAKK